LLLRELQLLGIYPVSQFQVGSYRIDLALPEQMIAIECDGKEWHSSPEQADRDTTREEYLKSQGWRVIRFSGSDLYQDALRIAEVIAGKGVKEERTKWRSWGGSIFPINYEMDLPEHIEEREIQMAEEQGEYENYSLKGKEFESTEKIIEERYKHSA
jgi:very-short-patch-repair endonuclease